MTNTPTTFFGWIIFSDTAVSRILFTRAAYHIGNIPRRYDLWMLFRISGWNHPGNGHPGAG